MLTETKTVSGTASVQWYDYMATVAGLHQTRLSPTKSRSSHLYPLGYKQLQAQTNVASLQAAIKHTFLSKVVSILHDTRSGSHKSWAPAFSRLQLQPPFMCPDMSTPCQRQISPCFSLLWIWSSLVLFLLKSAGKL